MPPTFSRQYDDVTKTNIAHGTDSGCDYLKPMNFAVKDNLRLSKLSQFKSFEIKSSLLDI